LVRLSRLCLYNPASEFTRETNPDEIPPDYRWIWDATGPMSPSIHQAALEEPGKVEIKFVDPEKDITLRVRIYNSGLCEIITEKIQVAKYSEPPSRQCVCS
jgi:hypothetical protein